MGTLEMQEKKGIKLVQLNFSELLVNPFEFFDETLFKIKTQLNQIFSEILKKELSLNDIEYKSFHWDVGALDKIFQHERYSVIYRSDIGIKKTKQDGQERFLNRNQFKDLWNQYFEMAVREKNKYNQEIKYTPVQKLNLMVFDFICYCSIVKYLTAKDIQQVEELNSDQSKNYRKFLENMHNVEYLKPNQKKARIIYFISTYDIDVMFLQQSEFDIWNQFVLSNRYTLVKRLEKSCLIIYKNQSFPFNRDLEFEQRYSKEFSYLVEQNYIFIKLGKYLLISIHLNSGNNGCEQSYKLHLSLQKILIENPDIVFILGINSNHFIQHNIFNKYPDEQANITTKKKRTLFQIQFQKAGHNIEQVKDHLISNQKIFDGKVIKIDNMEIKSHSYQPSEEHPFANFMVFGRIKD